jgi:hypothetical protein
MRKQMNEQDPEYHGHEKPCGNQRGPPRKAKYYLVTDSE